MLYNNQIIDNTYQIIKEIGSGGMGVVYLAYHLRLEKYIVMKKIKGHYSDISFVRNEVDILKKLHHPYLPQVYDFIEYESNLYTIIDYIDGYDLDYYINNNFNFTEGQLIKWLAQLCEVLEYLHSQNPPILHTDIKPANIIITNEGDICLIDFGISLNNTYDIKGLSKNYSSPEQFFIAMNYNYSIENGICVDARTDIYSLGVTFYHLMTGIRPEPQTEGIVKLSMYQLPYNEALIGIIEKSMELNPNDRFESALQMKKAIVNMRKLDSRYKKYILTQIISSVLFGLVLIIGFIMIYYGNVNDISNNYQKDYAEFVNQIEKGDYDLAIEYGNGLINNSDYNTHIDENHRAEILYGIGNSYFEIDDYYNASQYYSKAIQYCGDDNKAEDYYRDYCIALINYGDLEKANQVLKEIEVKYPQSESAIVIDIMLLFKKHQYLEVVSSAEKAIPTIENLDNKRIVYLIKGDSLRELGDYDESVRAYEQALQIREDLSCLRKLGNTYLAYANKLSFNNMTLISRAKDYFEIIYYDYYATVDDMINLAQSYRLSGNNNSCIALLSEYVNDNEVDDYRVYMHLAIASSETGDNNTAFYCEKAHSLYNNYSEKTKEAFDDNDLKVMKELYKFYCNSAW